MGWNLSLVIVLQLSIWAMMVIMEAQKKNGYADDTENKIRFVLALIPFGWCLYMFFLYVVAAMVFSGILKTKKI